MLHGCVERNGLSTGHRSDVYATFEKRQEASLAAQGERGKGRLLLRARLQVSRLICFPNLAYSSTLSCVICSRIVSSLSSSALVSSSILVVPVASSSCACSSGRWKKASPILYLGHMSAVLRGARWSHRRTGSCRPRRRAPVPSTGRPAPPFLSAQGQRPHPRHQSEWGHTLFTLSSSSKTSSR